MIVLLATALAATARAEPAATANRASWPRAIEDNSFLLEEAYNQEDHVVQHIGSLTSVLRPQVDLTFTFTQEWPIGGQRHQLSYTIPWLSIDSHDASGPGDVLVNYRYQCFMKPNGAALAPRLSLILPTIDDDLGVDRTGVGVQVNVPLSWRVARDWVLHANAGFTMIPGVRPFVGGGGDRTLTGFSVGASVVWLLRPHLNLMLEAVAVRAEEYDDTGRIRREGEILLNPGLRLATDRSDLQIVPGVSLPVRFDDGRADPGLFLYLSFEHPFGSR